MANEVKEINARIQVRRDTSDSWRYNNGDIILLDGEIGMETDTGCWKVGDGVTPWSELGYQDLGFGRGDNTRDPEGKISSNFVTFDETREYDDGSIGNELKEIKEDINNVVIINGDYSDTTTAVGLADNLIAEEGITLSSEISTSVPPVYADEPFRTKATAIPFDGTTVTVGDGYETIKQINAVTVKKNQLIHNGNFGTIDNWVHPYLNMTVSDGVAELEVSLASEECRLQQVLEFKNNHKYLIKFKIKSEKDTVIKCQIGNEITLLSDMEVSGDTEYFVTSIASWSGNEPDGFRIYINVNGRLVVGDKVWISAVEVVDLTSFFESRPEIATALSGDEGVKWFLTNYPEFGGYVGYNEGELVNTGAFDYITVGINLWDEVYRKGYYNTSGEYIESQSNICSMNYIPVVQGNTYRITIQDYTTFSEVCLYDNERNFIKRISTDAVTDNGQVVGRTFTIPIGTCYIRFNVGASQAPVQDLSHPIQLSFKFSEESKERTYHSHWSQSKRVDWTFAGGKGKSVLNVSDYKDFENKKNHKKVASVDMGELTYSISQYQDHIRISTRTQLSDAIIDTIHTTRLLCSVYMSSNAPTRTNNVDKTISIYDGHLYFRDDSLEGKTSAEIAEALSGVYVYYPLAEEIITDMTDEEASNIIREDDYGTEIQMPVAEGDFSPAGMTIFYQDNLKQKINNNAQAIRDIKDDIGKLSDLDTTNKTSIVNAINTLVARIEALERGEV